MAVKGKLVAETFIGFLERLLKNQVKPVFLVVDGQPVHRSLQVKAFIVATEGKLGFFYLPVCPLELNLNEQVWNQPETT